MSKLRRFQTFPFRRKAALRAFSQRSGAKGESSEAQIVRLFVHGLASWLKVQPMSGFSG